MASQSTTKPLTKPRLAQQNSVPNSLQSVQMPSKPKLREFEDSEVDAELANLNKQFGDIKKKPDQTSMLSQPLTSVISQ